jgi:hypothetical protein
LHTSREVENSAYAGLLLLPSSLFQIHLVGLVALYEQTCLFVPLLFFLQSRFHIYGENEKSIMDEKVASLVP